MELSSWRTPRAASKYFLAKNIDIHLFEPQKEPLEVLKSIKVIQIYLFMNLDLATQMKN